MRQVLGLDIRLKALDYLVLADDVIELFRTVLLNPDLLFDNRPLPECIELSIYQHFLICSFMFPLWRPFRFLEKTEFLSKFLSILTNRYIIQMKHL
jgi:hypothetical protein